MKHSERPKQLCLQLSFMHGLNIFAIQPNFLAGGIVLKFDSIILGLFLKFLGMVEDLVTFNYQLSELL